jgi:Protein of unknown function (DUF3467)
VSESEEEQAHLVFQVPPELEAGVYANFLAVWHTPHEFTLDFAVLLPGGSSDPGDPAAPVQMSSRLVSRVKLPPSVVFDVLRAINENMTRYESSFGPIRRPDDEAPPK